MVAGGAAASVACLVAAASLWRLGAAELRWDGHHWWLARTAAATPIAGGVRVAIDLGSFLLLRFEPAGGGLARWLPVDAGAVGGGWHALRCALYCARPDPAAPRLGAPSP